MTKEYCILEGTDRLIKKGYDPLLALEVAQQTYKDVKKECQASQKNGTETQ